MLPRPWLWFAALPQIVFWALALADPWFRRVKALRKLTAIPRAFAVLVFSAVCALKVLFVPPRELWVEARAGSTAKMRI
jgi:hypothetical protein